LLTTIPNRAIEFSKREDFEDALKNLDGGKLDGVRVRLVDDTGKG